MLIATANSSSFSQLLSDRWRGFSGELREIPSWRAGARILRINAAHRDSRNLGFFGHIDRGSLALLRREGTTSE